MSKYRTFDCWNPKKNLKWDCPMHYHDMTYNNIEVILRAVLMFLWFEQVWLFIQDEVNNLFIQNTRYSQPITRSLFTSWISTDKYMYSFKHKENLLIFYSSVGKKTYSKRREEKKTLRKKPIRWCQYSDNRSFIKWQNNSKNKASDYLLWESITED